MFKNTFKISACQARWGGEGTRTRGCNVPEAVQKLVFCFVLKKATLSGGIGGKDWVEGVHIHIVSVILK